jgi:hypothetical protein
VVTLVVLTTIAAAVFFLAYFLIALVREQKTIRPHRVGSTSVQSVGYQSLGIEPGAVIWLAPATVHKVARITHSSGHWRRTAPGAKKHLPEPRLKLV